MSARLIATEIGRSPSTVSRELARNTGPGGRYGATVAQRLASGRQRRPRLRRVEHDVVLCRFVQQCLGVQWSPEQISYALGVEFPHEPARQLEAMRSTFIPDSHVQVSWFTGTGPEFVDASQKIHKQGSRGTTKSFAT